MPALFRNNATATIAASITNTDTTIVLAAGLGNSFPLPTGSNYFYGTLFDNVGNYEIVKVTARVTDTLIVVRAQDSTNPLPFNSGAGFAMRPVAAIFNNFVQLDDSKTLTGSLTFSGATNFVGVATAVTKAPGTNSTELATTAFVVNAISSAVLASGTRATFNQTTAPTGWTKDTSINNAAFRLVSGSVGSGGSIDFTTLFGSSSSAIPAGSVSTSISSISGSAGATTLSTPQIPSHSHSTNIQGNGGNPGTGTLITSNLGTIQTSDTGGGGSHTHPFSFSSGSATSSFTGNALNLAVKYVDLIIAQKN